MIEYVIIAFVAGMLIPGIIIIDKWAWVKLPKNAVLQLEINQTGTAKIVKVPNKLGPLNTIENPGGHGVIQYTGRPLDLRDQKCRLFLHYSELPNTTPAGVGAHLSLLKRRGKTKKDLDEVLKMSPKDRDAWARQAANTTTKEEDAEGLFFDLRDTMAYIDKTESPEELETLASEFAMKRVGFKRWILGSGGGIPWGKLLLYVGIFGIAIFILIFVAPALMQMVGVG